MKILIIIFAMVLLSSCTKDVTNTTPPELKKTNTQSDSVPLPTGEDIVRTFFELINEKRIPEAISMMSEKSAPDDATKQDWGVQFGAFKSVQVTKIEKYSAENWKDNWQEYQVTLETDMVPESANGPIPYYGYDAKVNIRWVTIEKNSENLWKISGISTGP